MTATPANTTQASDRQLVVYENSQASPNHGRLIAIPPDQATGIAIPTFDIVTARPPVGTTRGESVFETSTRSAFVWDGAAWRDVTPQAGIHEWDPVMAYQDGSLVYHNNQLWISNAAVPTGVEPLPGVASWTRVGTGNQLKFEGFNAVESYAVGDHVYQNNALFEALAPSTGVAPVWPTDTTEWRYVGQLPHISNNPAPDLQVGAVMMWDGGQWIIKPPSSKIVIEAGDFNSSTAQVNRSNTPVVDLTQYQHGTGSFHTHIGSQPLDYSTFGICLYSANATSYQLSHTRAYSSFESGGTWARAGDTTYYNQTPIDEAGIGFTNRKIFYGGSTGKINVKEDSPEFLDVKWSYHNHRLTIFLSWWFESSGSKGIGRHMEASITAISSAANPITGFSLNEGGGAQFRSWVKLIIDPD
jgi:hypothetical protein